MRGVSNDPLREDPLSKKPVLLAITSDVHCGSTLAATPPEGVTLDDGGTYTPSPLQAWIWDNW